jgi:hypothetical protein
MLKELKRGQRRLKRTQPGISEREFFLQMELGLPRPE